MKTFLCGITGPGKEANLRALLDPFGAAKPGILDYFDGGVWTFHLPKDEGAAYLESLRPSGMDVIYARYCARHGYSMSHYLWQGPMQDGDFFVQVDDMERLGADFCSDKLPDLIRTMQANDVAMLANYGKGLVYRYNELLEFRGSPHWYATNLDGKAMNVELSKQDFWNVRAEQREPYQWVEHYLKYWLFPAGSNHALLGLEKQGDPQKLFGPREERRLRFRKELVKRGVPLTVDGVKALFAQPLDDVIKSHVNAEKTLNDAYRLFQLGDKTVVDTHNPKDMVRIP